MAIPFSSEQFFEVFARYNAATWPAPIVLPVVAIAGIAGLFVQRGWDRAIGWLLALLWAWMAVAYHWVFFARINPAAWIFAPRFYWRPGSLRGRPRRGGCASSAHGAWLSGGRCSPWPTLWLDTHG
jgi:hypothetical protein